ATKSWRRRERRPSRRAASSRASGEGRCSEWLRCSAIRAQIHVRPLTLPGGRAIERQIECQHVHPWLAQKTESTALDMLLDQLAHAIFGHVARFRNTAHLEKRGGG